MAAAPDPTALAPPETTPVAEPQCAYDGGSLERCAELKTTRPDAWSVLHHGDPIEVERHRVEATAVLMSGTFPASR